MLANTFAVHQLLAHVANISCILVFFFIYIYKKVDEQLVQRGADHGLHAEGRSSTYTEPAVSKALILTSTELELISNS